jgi:eukaryotic-like serine/threonine-protein kinase
MSTLNPEQWRALAPYLDEALEMDEEQRATWLSSLSVENPLLSAQLAPLLQEYSLLAKAGFMDASPTSPPIAETGLAGQVIGSYTLISQIGQGGMGSVWLAERNDGRFQRRVAVKFLNLALVGRTNEERFKREGAILGRLSHPNIAELVDAGVSATGFPYLVLGYVAGDHIDRYCDQHKLDVDARIRLFLDVAAAIAHAHANLIVHRDLKPSNVLVSNEGQVKLLDFGIAKLIEIKDSDAALTALTAPGGQVLTPEFAAPEQITGAPVTTATDVYALGILLYLLLTGEHPAGDKQKTPAELVKAIVDTEPRRLSDVATAAKADEAAATNHAAQRATSPDKLQRLLRGDLDTIVAKALKKNPQERYASVTALADDLRRHLRHEPISARPDTLAYRSSKFIRRNRTVVALVTLAFVATIAGVVGVLFQARTARAERDFAFRQMKRSAALNDFHDFLLSDAAPSGKPFTVNELLNRAQRIVERQRTNNDPDRVVLMLSIGRQFIEQDEATSARHILEEAYKLSRDLSDQTVRAEASCTLAASLARDEELSRAEALYQEGIRELPPSPQYALARIACLQSGSEIVQENGDIKEGIARAEAAQQILRQSPFDSDVLELERWSDLGKVYGSAGRDAEAVSAYERAGALITSLGRDETETAVTLFNNWAVELDQVGRPLDAEKLYRRAIDLSSTGPSDETVLPSTLCNYARSLRELGRLEEAADVAERAYNKAQRVGLQEVIIHLLLERAVIYTAQHKPARAAAMLREVEPMLRKALPPGHFAFATLAVDQARVALESGNVAEATKFADEAVSINEAAIKAGMEGNNTFPMILICRSTVALAGGRAEQSATDASRAVKLLQAGGEQGNASSRLGNAYLALGHALRAQGKSEESRAAFRSAVENLQSTIGPDHPDTLGARQLAGIDSPHQ